MYQGKMIIQDNIGFLFILLMSDVNEINNTFNTNKVLNFITLNVKISIYNFKIWLKTFFPLMYISITHCSHINFYIDMILRKHLQ